jgi:hypothetical protein
LLVYLPGGVPFLGGTLRDISAPNARVYLSPLYDSSQQGLADIVSLLGYFQHNGEKTEKMLLSLARVIVFASQEKSSTQFLKRSLSFKPLASWSTHSLLSIGIIKGAANNDLFVGETPLIRYFDPVGGHGVAAEASVEDLAATASDQITG